MNRYERYIDKKHNIDFVGPFDIRPLMLETRARYSHGVRFVNELLSHPLTGNTVVATTVMHFVELCTIYPIDEGFNGCVEINPEAYILKSTRLALKSALLLYFTPLQVLTAVNWCRLGRIWCFNKYRR